MKLAGLFTFAVVVLMQDVWLPLVTMSVDVETAEILLQSKLVVAALLAAALLFGRLNEGEAAWPGFAAFALVLLVLAYVVVDHNLGVSTLASAASLLSPVLLFCIGLWSGLSAEQVHRFIQAVVVFSVVSVLLGAADQVFLSASRVWVDILQLPTYLREVKGVPNYSFEPLEGLPYNFFFGFSRHGGTRRLVGLTGSTLTTAYAFLLPMLYLLSRMMLNLGGTRDRLLFFVVLSGLLLTLTRGAILSGLVAVVVLALATRAVRGAARSRRRASAMILVLGTCVAAGSTFGRRVIELTLSGEDGSTAGHVSGTLAGLRILDEVVLFGHGLGAAGGAGRSLSSQTDVGENAYLVAAAQVGIPGALLFLGWLVTVVVALLRCSRTTTSPVMLSAAGAAVGVIFSGIFSEQLLTFNSNVATWIFIGAAMSLPRSTSGAAESSLEPVGARAS